jgi:hypothetical protein
VKLCLNCKHCEFEGGWSGGADTPGDPMRFLCAKHVWSLGGDYEDKPRLIRCMKKAETCKDYTPEAE